MGSGPVKSTFPSSDPELVFPQYQTEYDDGFYIGSQWTQGNMRDIHIAFEEKFDYPSFAPGSNLTVDGGKVTSDQALPCGGLRGHPKDFYYLSTGMNPYVREQFAQANGGNSPNSWAICFSQRCKALSNYGANGPADMSEADLKIVADRAKELAYGGDTSPEASLTGTHNDHTAILEDVYAHVIESPEKFSTEFLAQAAGYWLVRLVVDEENSGPAAKLVQDLMTQGTGSLYWRILTIHEPSYPVIVRLPVFISAIVNNEFLQKYFDQQGYAYSQQRWDLMIGIIQDEKVDGDLRFTVSGIMWNEVKGTDQEKAAQDFLRYYGFRYDGM